MGLKQLTSAVRIHSQQQSQTHLDSILSLFYNNIVIVIALVIVILYFFDTYITSEVFFIQSKMMSFILGPSSSSSWDEHVLLDQCCHHGKDHQYHICGFPPGKHCWDASPCSSAARTLGRWCRSTPSRPGNDKVMITEAIMSSTKKATVLLFSKEKKKETSPLCQVTPSPRCWEKDLVS